jgi:hypothetical protein
LAISKRLERSTLFCLKTNEKIRENILTKEFDSQPYDYPVGNIFYVKVSNEYEKKVINDYFFIIKDEDCLKIYELKKVILPQL